VGKNDVVGSFVQTARRVLRVSWLVFIGLLGLLTLFVIFSIYVAPYSRSWWFRHELLRALDNASSVSVVEHSNRQDIGYLDPNHEDYKEVTYATVSLTPIQIELFRKALPLTPSPDGIKQCKFEEHHYIAITRHDGSVVTFHICIHCGQIEMGDRYGDMPDGREANLRGFVSSLGLHPDGPWDGYPVGPK